MIRKLKSAQEEPSQPERNSHKVLSESDVAALPKIQPSGGSEKPERISFSLPTSKANELKETAGQGKGALSKHIRTAIETDMLLRKVVEDGGDILIRKHTGELLRLEIDN